MNFGFQRRTDLALAVLRALAEADGVRLPGAVLADRVETTISYLPQVIAPLVQAGWVASDRGPGGGYRLTDAAENLRLLEVIEATEGPADHGRCVLREGPCPGDQPCPIHYVWSEARQVLVDGFAAVPAMPTHLKGARS
jgi:Rrf2 family iron-sulfur cluster assembly transcriptional regulator